jgi:hypothetical protein
MVINVASPGRPFQSMAHHVDVVLMHVEVRHEVRTDLEVQVLPRKLAHGIEYRVLGLWR